MKNFDATQLSYFTGTERWRELMLGRCAPYTYQLCESRAHKKASAKLASR